MCMTVLVIVADDGEVDTGKQTRPDRHAYIHINRTNHLHCITTRDVRGQLQLEITQHLT